MNYYNPNFYGNYPYVSNSQYGAAMQPQITIPSQLNGKLVDSEEVVRATEVPIGGYGIFPKADFSEIYIKSWNQNGTTNISVFKPTSILEDKPKEDISLMLDKINKIEEKIDAVLNKNAGTQAPGSIEATPAARKDF